MAKKTRICPHFSFLLLLILISTISNSFAVNRSEPSSHSHNTQYAQEIAKFYGLNSAKHLTLLKIDAYQQSEDYTCGPAAVMSLLHYYGKLTKQQMNKGTELKIAADMGTSKEIGTSAQQIFVWLNQHGFHAKMARHGNTSLLKNYLEKGVPILVNWIDWGGHWALVVGYKMQDSHLNQKTDVLFLADPAVHDDSMNYLHGLNFFNADRFASMWFNSSLERGIYIVATPN